MWSFQAVQKDPLILSNSPNMCCWKHGFPRCSELALSFWVDLSPSPISPSGTAASLMGSQQRESLGTQAFIFSPSQKNSHWLKEEKRRLGQMLERKGDGYSYYQWPLMCKDQVTRNQKEQLHWNAPQMQEICKNPTWQYVEEHNSAEQRCQ